MYFESYGDFLNKCSPKKYERVKTKIEKDGGYDPEKHGYIGYNEKGLDGKPTLSSPLNVAILLALMDPKDKIEVIKHYGRRRTPMAEKRQKEMQREYIIKHNEGKKYNP